MFHSQQYCLLLYIAQVLYYYVVQPNIDVSCYANIVIKIVNYFRSHALAHRQFKNFLKEIDSVYFRRVRGSSCGRCLQRFYQLRKEIDLFVNDKQRPVPELRNDE
jgi:hypothetical protein